MGCLTHTEEKIPTLFNNNIVCSSLYCYMEMKYS